MESLLANPQTDFVNSIQSLLPFTLLLKSLLFHIVRVGLCPHLPRQHDQSIGFCQCRTAVDGPIDHSAKKRPLKKSVNFDHEIMEIGLICINMMRI
jgi:hypothetical protein